MNTLDTTTRAEREAADQAIYDSVLRGRLADDARTAARRSQNRPILDDTPPRRLSDDELGGRAALEAAGLEPTDGWDDERPRASTIGAPIGTDRARELAAKSNQADRRPALTSARVRQLSALAELVRPRAKARSEMYGLPRHQADDIRRAIAYIDDLALWERRHR